MKKLQKLLYWISVVPPICDGIIGIVKGVVKGINDAKKNAQLEWDNEQNNKFIASFKNPVSNLENVKK